jgi:hypothetical protein
MGSNIIGGTDLNGVPVQFPRETSNALVGVTFLSLYMRSTPGNQFAQNSAILTGAVPEQGVFCGNGNLTRRVKGAGGP